MNPGVESDQDGPGPSGPRPEWTQARVDPSPSGPRSEWTQSGMDAVRNGPSPEWTQALNEARTTLEETPPETND